MINIPTLLDYFLCNGGTINAFNDPNSNTIWKETYKDKPEKWVMSEQAIYTWGSFAMKEKYIPLYEPPNIGFHAGEMFQYVVSGAGAQYTKPRAPWKGRTINEVKQ